MADDPINQQQFAQDVKDAEAYQNLHSQNGGNMKLPSADEILKIIEQMDGISDEERKNIRESILNPQEGAAEEYIRNLAQPEAGQTSSDYIMFTAMVAIIVIIFALFAFKLYKSLTPRDSKKQGKKSKLSKNIKKKN